MTGEQASLAATIAGAGLVCFPTDTVYGIGGVVAPATAAAIARVKGRRPDKPLQVVYPTVDLLLSAVALSPAVAAAARRLLPGPFTLVVPYPEDMVFPPPGAAEWAPGEGGHDAGRRRRAAHAADAGRARAGLAAGGAGAGPAAVPAARLVGQPERGRGPGRSVRRRARRARRL